MLFYRTDEFFLKSSGTSPNTVFKEFVFNQQTNNMERCWHALVFLKSALIVIISHVQGHEKGKDVERSRVRKRPTSREQRKPDAVGGEVKDQVARKGWEIGTTWFKNVAKEKSQAGSGAWQRKLEAHLHPVRGTKTRPFRAHLPDCRRAGALRSLSHRAFQLKGASVSIQTIPGNSLSLKARKMRHGERQVHICPTHAEQICHRPGTPVLGVWLRVQVLLFSFDVFGPETEFLILATQSDVHGSAPSTSPGSLVDLQDLSPQPSCWIRTCFKPDTGDWCDSWEPRPSCLSTSTSDPSPNPWPSSPL